MAQFDFPVIDPQVATGTDLAAWLNQWVAAMESQHAGAARPPYATPGMLWVQQVNANLWNVNLYTGTGDVRIGSLDPATGQFTPVGGGLPVGSIIDFGGAGAPPADYLACDGALLLRVGTYAALFAVIGTTWGAGDGATTFALPPLNRRATVGAGGVSSPTLGNAVGNVGGAETHVLAAPELPASGLTIPALGVSGTSSTDLFTQNGAGSGSGVPSIRDNAGTPILFLPNGANNISLGSWSGTINGTTAPGTTGNMGTGQAHNNLGPRAVVQKIIKFR